VHIQDQTFIELANCLKLRGFSEQNHALKAHKTAFCGRQIIGKAAGWFGAV
jgi:hypothetical protein